VKGIYRTDESIKVATARVHVVVSDREVRKIGGYAFDWCKNLVKVLAPFEEVGEEAFRTTLNLRHVTFNPHVVVKPGAFTFASRSRSL